METIDQAILMETETSDKFIRQLMSSLMLSTKASNSLPSGEEDFNKEIKSASETVAGQIHDLSRWINSSSDVDLSDDLVDSNLYEQVVDVIDTLLEKADMKLDELTNGYKQRTASSLQLSMATDRDRITSSAVESCSKPQMAFLNEIDNNRETPFYPKLKEKPNSLIPLDIKAYPSEIDVESDDPAIRPQVYYKHPYEVELQKLQYQPWQLEDAVRESSRGLIPPVAQPFAFVESEDVLLRMVDELDSCRELAIDLEHHSYRTFQGFTCLIQISTRSKNYVIDAIKLRSCLFTLLPVLTDPEVVKVFHGCDSDILWLQRDFGLYIVNCFDTYQAAKLLKYPALSLAHLLKFHCNVTLNKKHQLSDWRTRPLSDEMISYARDDTHYLLYVYDLMKKALTREFGIQGVVAVLDASKRTCMQRYEKEAFHPRGYMRVLQLAASRKGAAAATVAISKSIRNAPISGKVTAIDLSLEQDLALSALWDWRDATARAQDECLQYIMSNAELIRIGLTVPRDESQLLNGCRPLSATVIASARDIIAALHARLVGGDSIPVEGRKKIPSPAQTPVLSGTSFQANQCSTAAQSRPPRTQHESKFSFTPTPHPVPVSLPPPSTPESRGGGSSGGGGGSSRTNETGFMSPVLGTDEIYHLAGWKTPLPFATDPSDVGMQDSASNVPDPLRDTSIEGRLKRALEDLRKDQQTGPKLPTVPKWNPVDQSNNEEAEEMEMGDDEVGEGEVEGGGHCEGDEVGEADSVTLKSIPTSLAEIYRISNQNRRRNKNRKRTHGRGDGDHDGDDDAYADDGDSGGGADDATAGGEVPYKSVLDGPDASGAQESYRSMDAAEEFYFGHDAKNLDTGIDNTLEFLQGVGWLSKDPEQKLAVLETHLREQAERAEGGAGATHVPDDQGRMSRSSSHQGQPGSEKRGGGGGGTGKSPTRNNQRPSQSSPVSRGGLASNGSSAQQPASHNNRPNKVQQKTQGSGHQKEAFDYSQMPTALGAMAGMQSTGPPANPYLAAAAPRGAQSTMPHRSMDQGNNKSGQRKAASGGQGQMPQSLQAQMEKKDRDTTMTFSSRR